MPKSTRNLMMVAFVALVVSAGVIWASNNVPSVKRSIG